MNKNNKNNTLMYYILAYIDNIFNVQTVLARWRLEDVNLLGEF